MVDEPRIQMAVREILLAIGEDPDRKGLADTPRRVARFWAEFIGYFDSSPLTSFEAHYSDQKVTVGEIMSWSLCEHHLIPFKVRVEIKYRPAGRILGLSKFGRIMHTLCHRLQVQERLTADIFAIVASATGSDDISVKVVGRHLCMAMRGIKTNGLMVTTKASGIFSEDGSTVTHSVNGHLTTLAQDRVLE